MQRRWVGLPTEMRNFNTEGQRAMKNMKSGFPPSPTTLPVGKNALEPNKLMKPDPLPDTAAGKLPIVGKTPKPSVPIHFEKTVEWAFVKKCLPEFQWAAPLAGEHEKWGDVMAKIADQWLLVEFKRVASEIKTESAKYPATSSERVAYLMKIVEEKSESEKQAMQDKICEANVEFELIKTKVDAPHIIIYGKLNNDGDAIGLGGVPYWFWTIEEKMDWKKFTFEPTTQIYSSIGINFLEFEKYASRVVKAKAGRWTTSGSDSHTGVVGLKGGKTAVSMPLDQFLVASNLVPVETLTAEAAGYRYVPGTNSYPAPKV